LARTAGALGEVRAAQILFDLIVPHAGRMSWAGSCTYGPIDLALGLLCRVLGEDTRADEYFASSNSLVRSLGCVSYVVS
jgi:hypothetical protein